MDPRVGAELRGRHHPHADPRHHRLARGLAALDLDRRTDPQAGAAHLLLQGLAGHRALLAQHQRHVVEIGEPDRLAPGPRMAERNEGDDRVVAQGQRKQPLVADVPAQQGQVGLVAEQSLQRLVGIAGLHPHRDARIALAETRDLRQYVHRRIHRQGQGAGLQGAGGGQQLLRLGLDREQPLGHREQALAQFAQAHRALVTVEQQHAVTLLQLAHLVGNRRLGEKQALGGAREAAVHGDRMESLQLCMGYRHGPSPFQAGQGVPRHGRRTRE
ncbi:Uncharacterised protein [Acinetobacter baumannii]|nr:Uncharacterised protein [Acinetobacter baumannii]